MPAATMRLIGSFAGSGLQWLGAIACVLTVSGCERGHYHLDLSVDGASLHRELRYTNAHGENEAPTPVEAKEAQLLATTYGVPVPHPLPSELVLSGTFAGPTPGDIGGAGSLQHWQTPLGDSWTYVERFRGNDEPRATLVARGAAADELVDLLRDWFRVELQDASDAERVLAFLNSDFRNDVRNLTTYVWLEEAAREVNRDEPTRNDEFLARIGLYAAERGYLEIKDLARLETVNDSSEQLAFVRDLLARRLEIDLSQDEWAFLKTPQSVEQSLNAALANHETIRQKAELHPPAEYTLAVLLRAGGGRPGAYDGLSVRLHLDHAPFRTNGEWNPADGCVVWERTLPTRDEEPTQPLPAVVYAEWSRPDAAFQTAHFGKAVLADEALLKYCAWSDSLIDEQRQAWDAFLATLQPGPQIAAQIQGFVFPPAPAAAGTAAIGPPSVLVEALNAE